MYMATNDMAGLNDEIYKAGESMVQLNKAGDGFDVSAMGLRQMREAAKALNVPMDELIAGSKKLRAIDFNKAQIKISVDKKTEDFIANTAYLKGGQATISINGTEKLVSALNADDVGKLKTIQDEKASLAQRALQAQSFDEAFTNLIDGFKTTMMPIVQGINETLLPFVQQIFGDADFKAKLVGLGHDIGDLVKTAAKFAITIGGFLESMGPAGAIGGVLLGGAIFDTAKWAINGTVMAMAFNAETAGSLGGIGKAMGPLGKIVGGLTAALVGIGGGTLVGGGGKGATIGSTAGTIIGGVAGMYFGGPTGEMLGSTLGGFGGGYLGGLFDDKTTPTVNQPVNDATFGGASNRGIIQGGQITPINNRDQLIAAKKGGPVDNVLNNNNSSGEMKMSFDPITINGSIMITTPNGSSVDASSLLKDASFLRDLTRIVHVESSKALNGGKVGSQNQS
jgi:hypothetical protein